MSRSLPLKASYVVVIVVRGEGHDAETLLLRRDSKDFHGAWCHVAGGIEKGETAWQTGLRELFEEAGLVPEAYFTAGICEQFYSEERGYIGIGPVFVAFVKAGASVKMDHEHSDYKWVRFEGVEEHLSTGNQCAIFAHVRNYFVQQKPPERSRIEFNT
jgi:dihydroneopterin triphosphate diphosphatase